MQPICRLYRRAALLTCVSNFVAGGPGHSALILDSHVYTFEIGSGWDNCRKSGWLQYKATDYLKANTHRPVVIQELSQARLNATAVHGYIVKSDLADEDFIEHGVCSQQAAEALSAGLGMKVNPWGMNTPYAVYNFIKKSGCVADSYHVWPEHTGYRFHEKRLLHNLYHPECEHRCDKPPVLSW